MGHNMKRARYILGTLAISVAAAGLLSSPAQASTPGWQNCSSWHQVDSVRYPNVWAYNCLQVDSSGSWKRSYVQVKNFGTTGTLWYNKLDSHILGDLTDSSLATCKSGQAFSILPGSMAECYGNWVPDSYQGGPGGYGSGDIWSWNGSVYSKRYI